MIMKLHESFSNYRMITLDQGVALCANHAITQEYDGDYPFNTLFFLINDDGTNGTPEAETFVRPYAYWPNPAQDQLHLKYSPDVKPMQVELYNLQGRLVRTQSKDLESLSLQGLSAGTYTMRVMLEDGKVFSDKMVKE